MKDTLAKIIINGYASPEGIPVRQHDPSGRRAVLFFKDNKEYGTP